MSYHWSSIAMLARSEDGDIDHISHGDDEAVHWKWWSSSVSTSNINALWTTSSNFANSSWMLWNSRRTFSGIFKFEPQKREFFELRAWQNQPAKCELSSFKTISDPQLLETRQLLRFWAERNFEKMQHEKKLNYHHRDMYIKTKTTKNLWNLPFSDHVSRTK